VDRAGSAPFSLLESGTKFTQVQIYMDLNVLEDLNLVDGGPARNWSVFVASFGFKILWFGPRMVRT